MASTSPAVASLFPRSPIKLSARCPHCNSPRLIKKGARKKKVERVPIMRCRSCSRSFTIGPRPIRNKTYPANEILEALTLYNRGYSLQETALRISSRFGRSAAPSTISRWLSDYTGSQRIRVSAIVAASYSNLRRPLGRLNSIIDRSMNFPAIVPNLHC